MVEESSNIKKALMYLAKNLDVEIVERDEHQNNDLDSIFYYIAEHVREYGELPFENYILGHLTLRIAPKGEGIFEPGAIREFMLGIFPEASVQPNPDELNTYHIRCEDGLEMLMCEPNEAGDDTNLGTFILRHKTGHLDVECEYRWGVDVKAKASLQDPLSGTGIITTFEEKTPKKQKRHVSLYKDLIVIVYPKKDLVNDDEWPDIWNTEFCQKILGKDPKKRRIRENTIPTEEILKHYPQREDDQESPLKEH
jgi:hypothetical protein